MLRWTSNPVLEQALPYPLWWRTEEPNPDYRVKLAFAQDVNGRTYRRLTFPDRTHMFSELVYEGAK